MCKRCVCSHVPWCVAFPHHQVNTVRLPKLQPCQSLFLSVMQEFVLLCFKTLSYCPTYWHKTPFLVSTFKSVHLISALITHLGCCCIIFWPHLQYEGGDHSYHRGARACPVSCTSLFCLITHVLGVCAREMGRREKCTSEREIWARRGNFAKILRRTFSWVVVEFIFCRFLHLQEGVRTLLESSSSCATTMLCYTVTVSTGSQWFAGTDDYIYITLVGTERCSERTLLDKPLYNDFERGAVSEVLHCWGADGCVTNTFRRLRLFAHVNIKEEEVTTDVTWVCYKVNNSMLEEKSNFW